MITYSVPKPDLRPAFPTPDLPLLLSRFGDSAEPFVSAELLASYKAAIATIFTPKQAQAILDSLEEKDTNWSNAWFMKLLLSARFAVATTNRLSILISVPGASREMKVATLLRAVGVWSREYVFSAGSEDESRYTPVQKLVEWQLRGLCATFRVPKDLDTCVIGHASPEEARHAVVWCGGAAWRVEVVDGEGVVLPVEEIERQLLEILQVRAEKQLHISTLARVAALSWRLDRSQWHLRKAELEQVPENAVPFSTLYSSLVTVALEEHAAPADISERLDDVRMGETSENRFADQTFGIVSYSDGSTGLTFDHAPSDCGAALELTTILLSIVNSPAPPAPPAPPRSSSSNAANTAAPHPLGFTHTSPPQPCPASLIESMPRTVITIAIPAAAAAAAGIPRPHVSSRLTDTVVNLAVQAATLRTAETVTPMFQPVQLKRFHLGRCDSMVPVSHESILFARLAFAEPPHDAVALQHAFAAACKKRKQIIADTLDGTTTKYCSQGYVHVALRELASRPATEQPSGLSAVLSVFGIVSGRCVEGDDHVPTSIQFTGFTTTTNEIHGGLSNVFLPNQLVVFYVQRPDGTLVVSFSATGVYRAELPALVSCYRECYEVVAGIADAYVV